MVRLSEVRRFLDNYLKTDDVSEESWNGLQIEGKPEVKKIAFAVDASIDTFKKAIKEKADLVVVHHGQFWKSENPSIAGWIKERIDILYKNGVSLYVAHLPLDRHREVGHNALLLKLMGAKISEEFLEEHEKNIGWIGERQKPVALQKIVSTLNSELSTKCKVLSFGKKNIRKIAVCSGGGNDEDFFEVLHENVDLYVSGDSIDVYSTAKDAKMNVIFAGHYASETIGMKALAKVLAKKFGVKTVFVDVPTGL
ncbi:GTP cyclohydrolase 1 type 2 [uncultured archaeon]|nr:GTP cyclohydrolase 1 type 2 [uncultured archaeon]